MGDRFCEPMLGLFALSDNCMPVGNLLVQDTFLLRFNHETISSIGLTLLQTQAEQDMVDALLDTAQVFLKITQSSARVAKAKGLLFQKGCQRRGKTRQLVVT